jgi:hypothetical protein
VRVRIDRHRARDDEGGMRRASWACPHEELWLD